MDSTSQRQNGYENAMIEHENNLQNYRITWLVAIQGLLFAALSFAWDKKNADLIIGLIGALGVAVSLSSWSVLSLSTTAFRDLRAWWESHKPPSYDGPPIDAHRSDASLIVRILRPWKALPWLFAVSWVFIVCWRLSRG
jgi:hypothetical protein